MSPLVVLMTGCSSGMGLEIARRLALDPDHRFIVIATVISMSEKDDLEAAVKDHIGGRIFIIELDITKDDNITGVVEEVIERHGRIDMLFNIAAVAFYGVPERISREQIDQSFNVNVIGTIRLTQAVLPYMKERKSGKIITFSSVAGRIALPYSEIYNASKFAVEGFFEALATGLRAFNIRVCLIEPTQVNTGFWATILRQLNADVEDGTVNDIDHRQLGNRLAHLDKESILSVDDVVDVVMERCVEDDEPVLRHLIDSGAEETLSRTAVDLTGEAGLTAFGLTAVSNLE